MESCAECQSFWNRLEKKPAAALRYADGSFYSFLSWALDHQDLRWNHHESYGSCQKKPCKFREMRCNCKVAASNPVVEELDEYHKMRWGWVRGSPERMHLERRPRVSWLRRREEPQPFQEPSPRGCTWRLGPEPAHLNFALPIHISIFHICCLPCWTPSQVHLVGPGVPQTKRSVCQDPWPGS